VWNLRDYFGMRYRNPTRGNAKAWVYYTWIEPNYFRTLGIPLVLGRGLTVSAAAAKELRPGESPLGKTLRIGSDGEDHTAGEPLPDGPAWRVAGAARDTCGVQFDGGDAAQIYLPLPANSVQEEPLLVGRAQTLGGYRRAGGCGCFG